MKPLGQPKNEYLWPFGLSFWPLIFQNWVLRTLTWPKIWVLTLWDHTLRYHNACSMLIIWGVYSVSILSPCNRHWCFGPGLRPWTKWSEVSGLLWPWLWIRTCFPPAEPCLVETPQREVPPGTLASGLTSGPGILTSTQVLCLFISYHAKVIPRT